VIQGLTKNWMLLGLCGILEAIISGIFLSVHSLNGTVILLGKLAMAAGVLTIAGGVWRSATGKCWLLALNGLALGGLGVIWYALIRFRISLLTLALLVVVMALSVGVLELGITPTMRRQGHIMDQWFLPLTGVASIGFTLGFLALGLGWIKIEPGSNLDLLWLGSYFAFSALWKLGLALRLRCHGHSESNQRERLPPLAKRKTRTLTRNAPGSTRVFCRKTNKDRAWRHGIYKSCPAGQLFGKC
jgi:hypothetical protein